MTVRNDMIIRQGQTFSFQYVHAVGGSPFDLTGYSARMSLRTDFGGPQYAYLSTGSDADGGTITLGGVAGTITITMTAEQTKRLLDNLPTFSFPDEMHAAYGYSHRSEMIYDLEIEDGAGAVTRVLEGKVTIYREVTR